MKPTHLAVIGCGAWGRCIVRDLVALECRVTVVDPAPAGAARAREAGAAAIVSSVRELPAVDGVVVAVPSRQHAQVIEEVLARGVPVFTEKPFTTDAASARRLAALGAGRLFVLHKWRWHPGVEALAALARSEKLGPVLGLRLVHVGWGNNQRDIDAVWTLAPHSLSIALAVLGDLPAPRSAVATAAPGSADAHALSAILGGAPWATIELSTRSPEKLRRATLECVGGTAELVDGTDVLRIVRAGEGGALEEEARPFSPELPLLRELRDVRDHVRGGPPPRCGADEGLAVVEAIAHLRALAGLAP